MEIGRVPGVRPNLEAGRKASPKETDAPREKTEAQAVRDYLDLSRKAKKMAQQRPVFDHTWLQEQMDSARQQAQAEAKAQKVMAQCQKIARNIMSGNRVPPEDLRYLAQHDMKAYQLAMAMRRQEPDPEDCDRVSEDEEENAAQGASATSDAPAPTPPAAPEGGGDVSGESV